jgi:ribosomal protein L4
VTALLITLGASALAGAPAPTTDAARAGGSTASTCNGLLHQFDVAWPTHQQMTRAARAKKSRDLGESQCRDGRTAEGVRSLRRALHDIGVKPVKIVSSAAR